MGGSLVFISEKNIQVCELTARDSEPEATYSQTTIAVILMRSVSLQTHAPCLPRLPGKLCFQQVFHYLQSRDESADLCNLNLYCSPKRDWLDASVVSVLVFPAQMTARATPICSCAFNSSRFKDGGIVSKRKVSHNGAVEILSALVSSWADIHFSQMYVVASVACLLNVPRDIWLKDMQFCLLLPCSAPALTACGVSCKTIVGHSLL